MALGQEIKTTTIYVMRVVIKIGNYHNHDRRLPLMLDLDNGLKLLCELVPIVHGYKYITDANLATWIKKMTDIDNMAMAWVMKLDKEQNSKVKRHVP